MAKPIYKKGDRVQVLYLRDAPKKKIIGTVVSMYTTTFGGAVKDWGVRVKLDKPHQGRKTSTYRATNLKKV